MSTLDYFSCPLSALNRANESSKTGKLQQSCKASVQVKIINPSSPTLLTVMAINSKLITSRSEFWINILQNLLMWILSHNRCSRNRWVKIIHTRQRRSTSADWIGSFGSIDTVKALMCSQIHSFFVGLHQKVSLGYTYFTPYISILQLAPPVNCKWTYTGCCCCCCIFLHEFESCQAGGQENLVHRL